MREIGFTSKVFSPRSIVGQLSGGERQGVAIARAILKDANLIVLDEPTTALSLTETAKVFHFVRQVRDAGRSIVFIGHNIHHVYEIAERFVVLDRGKVAMEKPKSEVGSAQDLIKFMEDVAQARAALKWGRLRDVGHGQGARRQARRHAPERSPVAPDRCSRTARRWARSPSSWSCCSFFFVANPRVFSTWGLYVSVMTTLPVALFMAAPLVFVVTAGEIDLSFPAVFGFASLAFAVVVQAGFDPFLAIVAAILTGARARLRHRCARRLWRPVLAGCDLSA